MSEDPTEQLALIPGHFLIGAPILSVAEPEIKGGAVHQGSEPSIFCQMETKVFE